MRATVEGYLEEGEELAGESDDEEEDMVDEDSNGSSDGNLSSKRGAS